LWFGWFCLVVFLGFFFGGGGFRGVFLCLLTPAGGLSAGVERSRLLRKGESRQGRKIAGLVWREVVGFETAFPVCPAVPS